MVLYEPNSEEIEPTESTESTESTIVSNNRNHLDFIMRLNRLMEEFNASQTDLEEQTQDQFDELERSQNDPDYSEDEFKREIFEIQARHSTLRAAEVEIFRTNMTLFLGGQSSLS
jgi:hypothetical protein